MRTSWGKFEEAVKHAGLRPRHCSAGHYHIQGGDRLVNCWPNTKRGFVYQAHGEKSQVGTIGDAIRLSGPTKANPPEENSPPWEEPKNYQVGLIRRVWRWIW